MKELSIEERAKAYDEARARMSRAFNSNRCTIGFMNEIFPELAESEDADEKIRKALIKLVTNHASIDLFIDYGIHLDEALAWLEKQGEQKPNCCDGQKPKTHNGSDNPYDMSYPDAEGYISKRGFDVPWCDCDVFVDNRYITQTVGNILRWADDNPKQKPAEWSEEDKKRISSILLSIEDCKEQYPNLREYQYDIDWLNSLKERVQSQQKFRTKGICTNGEIIDFVEEHSQKLKDTLCHAWSEEDEKMLSNTIKDLVHPWNEYIPDRIEEEIKWLKNKLKSLRPQNRQEWNSKDKKIKNEIVNYFTCQCKDEPTRIKTLNRWICWLNALENSSVIKPMPEFDEWLKQIWDILDWAEEKGRITYSTWEDYTGWLSLLNPKNRWKPSEEQMDALETAVSSLQSTALESLYQDLKRL